MLKKVFRYFLFVSVFFSVCIFASSTGYAKDYIALEDGSYTIEITDKTPGADYIIIIVAGDYTDSDIPEITEDNLIYINSATADANGYIRFTDFIPMTGSVGTIYISDAAGAVTEGLLMNQSGFGYIAGRLISYSGSEATVTVPENFTSIDENAFGQDTERVILTENPDVIIAAGAFAKNTKLFLSPLSENIKQYAVDNGYAYSVIGDYDGDKAVNLNDYKAVIASYARGGNVSGEDLDIILDLDLDGKITLNDAAVLLKYLGGVISNISQKY